jgi:predicted DNA-binding helix-hairpin-helix protein
LLTTTEKLYRQFNMRRAYYSAFHPFPDTPLEDHPAENILRQNRLYQASFLLRDYGFEMEEMPLDDAGNLPLDSDPKLAWARSHLSEAPIDVNRADRHQLLRIPGIGPKGVNAILSTRRQVRITDLSQLGKIGINTDRVSPYILIDGRRPTFQTSFLSLQAFRNTAKVDILAV